MGTQNPNANFQQFAQPMQQPAQQPMQPVQPAQQSVQPSTIDLVAPSTERKFDYVSFIGFVKSHGGRITGGNTPVNKKFVYSVGSVYLHMKDDFKARSLELMRNSPEKLLVGISREVDADGNRGYLLVEDDPSRRRLEVVETFDFN